MMTISNLQLRKVFKHSDWPYYLRSDWSISFLITFTVMEDIGYLWHQKWVKVGHLWALDPTSRSGRVRFEFTLIGNWPSLVMRLPSAKRVLGHILLLAGNPALYRPLVAAKRKLSSQKLKFWKNYPWTKTSLRVLCLNQIGRWILYLNQWKRAKFISIDQNGLESLLGNLSEIELLPVIFIYSRGLPVLKDIKHTIVDRKYLFGFNGSQVGFQIDFVSSKSYWLRQWANQIENFSQWFSRIIPN